MNPAHEIPVNKSLEKDTIVTSILDDDYIDQACIISYEMEVYRGRKIVTAIKVMSNGIFTDLMLTMKDVIWNRLGEDVEFEVKEVTRY